MRQGCCIAAALAGFLMISCAEPEALDVVAVDVDPAASCALDGMLLAVHDGPKAQLLRADGSRGTFCDTKEIFEELLDPIRRRRVVGIWMQALDAHGWAAHADGWAPADSLLLVVGSSRMGAMGPTLAPFVDRLHAQEFIRDYGGRILQFTDVDQKLLEQLQHQGMAHLD
ncbi:MAG: nitrous oxide reductase accessory protein NosL [Gemmatimonadetes bacterium]|jgi:copper chaperone NosL|nr:nitrous oxide reductase accessory protein NosL [Gemmatimonadota bacterium]MBT4611717.1 nitrous oxide reductase accessory protein NosL [Gemmatimonadota bacterium]MBT5059415.1 nitrous oxide reductase accessory protein NosL [Gemmatimonadota bacterium]MBT5146503.1 nitrous oxide reductase accessory protein NosL [Gemmatimonadota bacterium]MBT5591424.1 nitrous oxide reductase accessory protein NosL [Gemmatimonadota bacterium]